MTWLCIGDSITEKNFRTALNYHDYISEELKLDVINEGLSGTGFLRDFEGNPSYLKRIRKYSPSPDIITIMGSLNDLDGDSSESELYAAMLQYIQMTIEYYPCSFIAVITPPPRALIHGKHWYIEKLKQAAKEFSLPCLDIYSETVIRPWINDSNKKYFSCNIAPEGDGVHPNELGHLILARRIRTFLETYVNFPQL